jgi:hypothetical protein
MSIMNLAKPESPGPAARVRVAVSASREHVCIERFLPNERAPGAIALDAHLLPIGGRNFFEG